MIEEGGVRMADSMKQKIGEDRPRRADADSVPERGMAITTTEIGNLSKRETHGRAPEFIAVGVCDVDLNLSTSGNVNKVVNRSSSDIVEFGAIFDDFVSAGHRPIKCQKETYRGLPEQAFSAGTTRGVDVSFGDSR
jgi:hypothetical protein